MPNEENTGVNPETTTEQTPEVSSEAESSTTDWKEKYESVQSEYESLQGRLKRAETKLTKKSESESTETPSPSSDLDYGQKAFLVANDIKGKDEMDLVKAIMTDTGKSLEEVMDSKYFQAELKEMREAKAVEAALPDGSKRSNQSASNTVEYWIAKGELPPAEQRDLRQQVVNARLKTETNTSQFTSNPVVK